MIILEFDSNISNITRRKVIKRVARITHGEPLSRRATREHRHRAFQLLTFNCFVLNSNQLVTTVIGWFFVCTNKKGVKNG
nr:MAG TPA: hypothetical protein [Bacteriophage sp.]